MSIIAAGKAADGYKGKPALDTMSDDELLASRDRITNIWHDRRKPRKESYSLTGTGPLAHDRIVDEARDWNS